MSNLMHDNWDNAEGGHVKEWNAWLLHRLKPVRLHVLGNLIVSLTVNVVVMLITSRDQSVTYICRSSTAINRPHIIPPNLRRHYLGRMDVLCRGLKAFHWADERLSNSTLTTPKFGKCCLQGTIKLPQLNAPPSALKALYDSHDVMSISFRRHLREYNTSNAFTSLGTTGVDRIITGPGPFPFTIYGELRHRTGSLLPEDGLNATYAQLYIYDLDTTLDIRMQRNPKLRQDVLLIIQNTLLQVNPFVGIYRRAFEILNQSELQGVSIPATLHYIASTDRRTYNLPTVDEIAIMLPGDGSSAGYHTTSSR
ncbi:hypothetical protein Dimus_039075 [Dionaea muscipula]